MRWSWPAFVSGGAAGAAICLLVLAGDREPVETIRWVREPRDESHARETALRGGRPEPRRERVREEARESAADEAEPARAEETPIAEPETDAGESPAAEVVESAIALGYVSRPVATVRTARAEFLAGVPLIGAGEKSAAAQGLARALTSAANIAEGAQGADIDALLASEDDGDLETAIGLLMRTDPPGVARLVALARDASVGGSLRATALLAAVQVAAAESAVASAVSDLSDDANVDVRRTAVSLLSRIGEPGAQRAAQLLRDGDYARDLLGPLAIAVARSDRALEFLLGSPPVEAAFAVLRCIDVAESQPRLLSRLPDAVRPLIRTSEMLTHAAEAFGVLAAAGHAPYLRSVSVDTSLPTSLRLAAVDAALGAPACADGRASLLAATLADRTSPVELLRAVLERVPAGDVADGAVKSAIDALAQSHPNSWLREEARARLQSSAPRVADGTLRIVSGVYGKDGKTTDVTQVLASMVVGGRLVVEAGNALAGDPLFGVVKDLAVTYEWKGERRTRTIREYETLTLP